MIPRTPIATIESWIKIYWLMAALLCRVLTIPRNFLLFPFKIDYKILVFFYPRINWEIPRHAGIFWFYSQIFNSSFLLSNKLGLIDQPLLFVFITQECNNLRSWRNVKIFGRRCVEGGHKMMTWFFWDFKIFLEIKCGEASNNHQSFKIKENGTRR